MHAAGDPARQPQDDPPAPRTPALPLPSGATLYGKVLQLPARGRAILCTDLHGNLGDFQAVVAAFRQAWAETDGEAFMLFTGDLVHGPSYPRRRWPEHLGTFYEDRTADLVDGFVALQQEFPGRVFSLIGNHEHSHIGGPHTRKFHKDPSETEHLERTVGREKALAYRDLFRTFPIACVLGRGVVATHGTPRVLEATFEEIADVEYGGYEDRTIRDMTQCPILGELFWCRNAGPLVVRRFLRRMELGGQRNRLVVYGHDPVRKGYLREGDEQLCFSTSFGLVDAKKVYLDLDLTRPYRSVRSLRYGADILPLYPAEASARRKARAAAAGS